MHCASHFICSRFTSLLLRAPVEFLSSFVLFLFVDILLRSAVQHVTNTHVVYRVHTRSVPWRGSAEGGSKDNVKVKAGRGLQKTKNKQRHVAEMKKCNRLSHIFYVYYYYIGVITLLL